jgi:hypothetical protein
VGWRPCNVGVPCLFIMEAVNDEGNIDWKVESDSCQWEAIAARRSNVGIKWRWGACFPVKVVNSGSGAVVEKVRSCKGRRPTVEALA